MSGFHLQVAVGGDVFDVRCGDNGEVVVAIVNGYGHAMSLLRRIYTKLPLTEGEFSDEEATVFNDLAKWNEWMDSTSMTISCTTTAT